MSKTNLSILNYATPQSIINCESIESVLARLVCKSNFSLNALSKSKELDFLIKKVYKCKMPSANTLKQYVNRYYTNIKDEIKEKIKKLGKDQDWTITFDEWTSVGVKQVMNVNLHFKQQSFNLGLIEVDGISCTSEHLLKLIEAKLNDFDLNTPGKTLIATADGAKVNMKLEKISKIHVQRCQNHGINLAILDTFYSKVSSRIELNTSDEEDLNLSDESESQTTSSEVVEYTSEEEEKEHENTDRHLTIAMLEYKSVIIKARKITNSIRNSPKLRRILSKYAPLKPIKEVKTRWSSLAKITERFIKILPEIRHTFIDAKKI